MGPAIVVQKGLPITEYDTESQMHRIPRFQQTRKSLGLMILLAFVGLSFFSDYFPTIIPYPDSAVGSGNELSPIPSPPSSSNVAVIIEDRPIHKIAPLLLHFSSVLGPSWPIILYTTKSHHSSYNSSAFLRAIAEERISIRYVPDEISFTKQRDIEEFTMMPWLWEQLAPAKHVFMFEADSIICSNSETKMEDFTAYDFIGAPIDTSRGAGFNGGFSLRNRALMLDVVTKSNWMEERRRAINSGNEDPTVLFEDQWFYAHIADREGVRLPTMDVAKGFAVETLWATQPLGYHRVQRWHGERMSIVDEWCPENRLSTLDLLVREGSLRD